VSFLKELNDALKPSYGLIGTLTESRLIPNTHTLRTWNGRDIADFTFLYLLSIEILRHEMATSHAMSTYSNSALRWGNFNAFVGNANDLYILLHILTGKNNQSAKEALADNVASNKFLDHLVVDPNKVKSYLRNVALEQYQPAWSRQFFLDLEAKLKIQTSNYRSIRRLVVDWPILNKADRQLVMTRLLQAFRARMLRSEIKGHLEKLAATQKLELKNVANPETGQQAPLPQASTPDLETIASMVTGPAAGAKFKK
jgi:hypothetical protein